MPPGTEYIEYRSTTKNLLLHKFIDGKWADRLRLMADAGEVELIDWPCGNFKRGFKWLDRKGKLVCRLFEHQNPDGPQLVVQELREGNVHWYDDERGPVVTTPHTEAAVNAIMKEK